MKILLTAINAKYIHSNLAVYNLRAYAAHYAKGMADSDTVEIGEYTINNQMEDILEGIYKAKPDVLMFSCYIWNIAFGFLGTNLLVMLLMIAGLTIAVVVTGIYTGYHLGFEHKTKAYIAGAILLWIAGIDVIVRHILR